MRGCGAVAGESSTVRPGIRRRRIRRQRPAPAGRCGLPDRTELGPGLSLGYEHTDLDTDFNQGTFENDGLSITPFFGLRLTEHAALDAGLGHARLSYDRSRDSGAARGSFDADRVSVFANLSGTAPQRWHGVQGLFLVGDVGFRYAREDQDGFEEGAATISSGTVELGQVTFGGEARFGLAPLDLRRITVFARAEGAVDVIREDRDVEDRFGAVSDDRTDVTPGVGVIAALTDRVSADLAYHHTLSREDFREQSLIAGGPVRVLRIRAPRRRDTGPSHGGSPADLSVEEGEEVSFTISLDDPELFSDAIPFTLTIVDGKADNNIPRFELSPQDPEQGITFFGRSGQCCGG